MAKARDPDILYDFKEIAAHTGVSEGTIRSEWSQKGMPGERSKGRAKGKYSKSAIFKWYRKTYVRAGGPTDGTMEQAKLVEQVEKAKIARLKREGMDGTVISREEHSDELHKRGRAFISEIGAIPGKAAARCAGKSAVQCMKILRDLCKAAQKRLYGERDR